MKVQFYELAIGAEFTALGKRHRKIAMSMAEWEDAEGRRTGSIFLGETPVESEGPFLSAEEAARWKPERGFWTGVVERILKGEG